jgi:hypothetical protein
MLSVKIQCDTDTSEPKIVSYDSSTMNVELSAPGGCPVNSDSERPPKDDKGDSEDGSKEEKVGSGIGWFFLM